MHEILFRGKRKDNGDWIEGYLFKTWDKAYILWGITNDIPNMIEVIPETVGHYTGLTDINSTKIYEGDILRTGTRMGYILFAKGCFRFRWKNFDKYRDDFFKTCIITEHGSFRELEVIGNIHDNSELLKGVTADA